MKFAESILNKERYDMPCRFDDFLKITKETFICEMNGKELPKAIWM